MVPPGAADKVTDVGPNASVKHYQQLTLMSVKSEKPALTALEDYRGVKVEVEYINGGSTVSVVNRDYECELNKNKEVVPIVETAFVTDTEPKAKKSAKSSRKSYKKTRSDTLTSEASEESNNSFKMKLKKRISKKRLNESARSGAQRQA